jgi:tape measure domain-containing protein
MDSETLELILKAQDEISDKLENVQKELKKLGDEADKSNKKGVSGFNTGLATLAVTAGNVLYRALQKASGAVIGIGKSMIQGAAQMEQQEIAFKTLLGSAEEANNVLNRIKDDAKATPFELPGLIDMNKRLVSAGIEAERAGDLVLSMGDAVSATGGTQVELDRLIANFQQIQSVGKASLMDIRQFGNAGIPIFDLLADSTGKTKDEIATMVSEGKIGFKELEAAFAGASGEGGQFANAMENQSKTLNGVISNITDTLGILGTEIIEESGLFDLIKNGAERFLKILEDNKMTIMEFINNLKEMAKTFITKVQKAFEWIKKNWKTIKAALIGIATAITVSLIPAFIAWSVAATSAAITTLAAIAPFVLIAGAVTGVALVVQKIIDLWPKLTEAWVYAVDVIKESWNLFVESFIGFLESIPEKIGMFINSLLEFFAQLPQKLLEILGMMIAYFVLFVTTLIQKTKDLIVAIINFFKELPGKIWESLIMIKDKSIEIWNNIRDNVKQKVEDIKTFFRNLPANIAQAWENIKIKVRETFDNVKQSLKDRIESIKKFFTEDLPNGAKLGVEKIKEFFLGIPDAIKDVLNNIIKKFEDAINGIIKGYNKVADATPGVPSINEVNLPRLATGTRNFRGGPAIVGENGIEIANLPPRTDVFNNRETSDILRGLARGETTEDTGGLNIENVNINNNMEFIEFVDKLNTALD